MDERRARTREWNGEFDLVICSGYPAANILLPELTNVEKGGSANVASVLRVRCRKHCALVKVGPCVRKSIITQVYRNVGDINVAWF